MSGRTQVTAVSAVLAALGLTSVVLVATAPLTAPRANAAGVAVADPTVILPSDPSDPSATPSPSVSPEATVAAADPDVVEPTDPDYTDEPGPAEPADEEPEPTVTITITETPAPVVTRTRTVTPTPTKKPAPAKTSKAPTPPPATNPAPISPPATVPSTVPTAAPILPTQELSQQPSADPEPQLSLAPASPTMPATTPEPTPSPAGFEEPDPDSQPIVIRNASPEYDQLTLSRKLAIPGVLLALLVMLGVWVFEGRIRRMAHAAAVRRAGPRRPGDDLPPGMMPIPGYPIQHGGATYAPIISFVPVQGYPLAPGDHSGYGPALPAGPAEPWPPADVPPAPPGGTAVFPAAGGVPDAGFTTAEVISTEAAGPAGHAKPRTGLFRRLFRRS
ncbi:hypothetical protein [Sphaerisporangium rufum]|uniref:hypothetical protein n=1 Tax=Sphaerisporangium rufum TaxID=1381558 RepID=UPI00195159D9|nr:hypothetical protein [Sphaerisporangium rufum]